jgi:hypothetical protein
MGPRARSLRHAVGVFVAITVASMPCRNAVACDSTNPEVHRSGNLIWCANPGEWSAHSSDISLFFPFADALLPQIQKDFGITSQQDFYIVVNAPNGYASTPTPYGPGVNVTGDAFYNTNYGIKGFYGYLFIVHEFVNQWTGLAINGGGWPTDWWANHRSPFPNAMDPIILAELGQTDAAKAQKARFVPGGDSADVQVPLFTEIFDTFGGWPMLRTFFAMLKNDGMQWQSLRDPPNFTQQTQFVSGNPSPLLANYVVAYMNLATGADLKSRFDAADIGTAPPNWDNSTPFKTYHLDANAIAGIAGAHCRLAVADSTLSATKAAASALKKGDYAGALAALPASTPCAQAQCTGACACDAPSNACMPKYLATVAPTGGGPAAAATSGGEAGTDVGVIPTPVGSDANAVALDGQSMQAGCACHSLAEPQWLGLIVGAMAWRRRRRRA